MCYTHSVLLPSTNATVAFSHVCSVYVLTFESLYLKCSFLVCRYFLRICMSRSILRSSGQVKIIRAKTGYVSLTRYTHSWVVYLWLKDSLVSHIIFDEFYILHICCFPWVESPSFSHTPEFYKTDGPHFWIWKVGPIWTGTHTCIIDFNFTLSRHTDLEVSTFLTNAVC